MNSSIKTAYYYSTRVTLPVAVADLASKAAIKHTIPYRAKVWLVDKTLYLTNEINRGYAFNQPGNFGWGEKIYFAVGLVSLAALFVKARSKVARLSLALIGGAAVGNLSERLVKGGVTDFIKLAGWYTGNLADIAAAVGTSLLLGDLLCGGLLAKSSTGTSTDKPGRGQTLVQAFTTRRWNTLGQMSLYLLTGLLAPLYPVSIGLVALAALPLSLLRDQLHRGQRGIFES
ncbi:MAG: signal peptidase II [Candidatus Margulisbacteria bacterium]|jgi:signal peptidase II|nr:signal peptidase II [Candidatus Margulisiibacteriota bacterium]